MRVKIIGYKPFKVTGKTDPSKIYEGINLQTVAPINPEYGKGLQCFEYTIWKNQISELLPNGADVFIDKTVDIFKNGKFVEAIMIPTK